MTKTVLILLSCFVFLTLTGSNNFSSSYKISKTAALELSSKQSNEKALIWIRFSDKGPEVSSLLSKPEVYLTKESIDRRKKIKPVNSLFDYTDIPVNYEYVNELKNAGIEIKNISKWFNGVSCYASKDQVDRIIDKNFITKIDLVMKFKKRVNDIETKNITVEHDDYQPLGIDYQLNYGSSLTQMEIINVPMAHDSGFKGQGVLIASFDAGFDNLSHPVFDSIRARGLRTYDFVNHDTNVANQSGQMGEGSHGTQTLSLVAGYRPGSLISPAFRSKYILAKTENTDSETPLEEDNWIAAAEWADSLGADIITSSLGYISMDGGSSHSYDWTWMNGDSCLITIGADLAVNKGILVINSAGNEGSHPTHNTLGAPSDGDSVIAVGSVNSNKQRSSFSSVGLSTDGRIKPDIVALGNGNYVAAPGAGNTGYSFGSGTSFSCPMAAGVCAVILSANPSLTPRQVWQILIQTADSTLTPNRRRGWGLINCWEAVKLAKPKTLNLKVLIEGFYDPVSNSMIQDTITASIRSNTAPFNEIENVKAKLNSSGSVMINFNDAVNSTPYYVVLNHRNGLETWSKFTQSFNSGNLIYDFTTDSAKAYGNNLKHSGSKWVIYEGDVNRDGTVSLADVIETFNDASVFLSGYSSTDLNGSNSVNLEDLIIAFNNSSQFISVSKP